MQCEEIDRLHQLNSEVDRQISKAVEIQRGSTLPLHVPGKCNDLTAHIDKENRSNTTKKCIKGVNQTVTDSLRKHLDEQLKLNSDLKTNLKLSKEENKKLENELIKFRGIITKNKKSVDVKDFEMTQAENSRLRKEVSSLRELVHEAEKKSIARESKLKRAMDDVNKMKASIIQQNTSSDRKDNDLDDTVTQMKDHIRELESQKKELILGFKKQMQLIDILKKQKENLEACIKLDIVDKDFAAALELGSNLKST